MDVGVGRDLDGPLWCSDQYVELCGVMTLVLISTCDAALGDDAISQFDIHA